MEVGTQILIERMKTHPEEFAEGEFSKWARAFNMANDCLPEEDKAALKQAYTQAKIDLYNEFVLKTLSGEVEVKDTYTYKAQGRYAFADGLNGVSNSVLTTTAPSAFGAVPIKAEGQAVQYDHKAYP